MGPDATSKEHCPGLKDKDTVLFSQFAGHHVSTREDKFVKIIRGYDIMATLEDINNITDSNVHPAANRILVAAKYRDETDDGLILNVDEARDPALADLDYGVVLKKGPACELPIEVGQTVAYTTYVGECVQKQPEENVAEYRVLVEDDILFTI
jgi:co-chaperonin GroES (HSP10)